MAGFKVKVILRGQRPYYIFPFRSVTLEPLQGFRRNLTQMFTRLRRCAEAMFWMAGLKVMYWPYIQNPASHLVSVLKPGM